MAAPRIPTPPAWASQILTVGITGTNGKTTTTAWVAAALQANSSPVPRATTVGFFLDEERVDVEKSYLGFIDGMKLARGRGATLAAIELTSESLARGFARAWPCRVAVFTNLTHDHLDAHGSPEHYLASKAQLFVSLPPGGIAVLNAADENYELLREVVPPHALQRSYAVPARGTPQGAPDLVATAVDVGWRGTKITCDVRDPASGLPRELSVRAIGSVYAENALAALLGAVAAGVDPAAAASLIASAAPPPGRFEVVHERPYVVVDYAHSPDALLRTVAIARALAKTARLFVVFGAGGKRDKDKRKPMGEAARTADVVLLTSDNPRDEDPAAIARSIAQGLQGHGDMRTILDRKQAIRTAILEAKDDDVVLVAGKGHETEQTIGAEVRHFSDVEVAREALAERRGSVVTSTTRFSDRVADYIRYRPGYPTAIVDFLHQNGVAKDARIADVGAGTGISTKLLLDAGHPVVAVEPNAAMREAGDALLAGRAGYESVLGTAEATGLPDGSVGLVFAAQAFHWFAGPAAKGEFLRILRREPGYDKVALVWNDRRTVGSEFLREYDEILRTYGTDYAAVAARYADDATMEAWFGGEVARASFPHAQRFDFEGLRGRLLSSSYAPKAGHPNHEPMLAALRELFDRTADPEGQVAFEYDARVYCGRPDGAE